jgi:hypothetical protein
MANLQRYVAVLHLSELEPDPELAALLSQAILPDFGQLTPADIPCLRPQFVSAVIPQIKERYRLLLPPGMRLIASQDSYSAAFTHFRRTSAIHGGRPYNRGRCGRDPHPCDNADTNGR